MQKRDYFEKIQENEKLRGGVYQYAAQGTPQFDAEILKTGRFRMENIHCLIISRFPAKDEVALSKPLIPAEKI